MSTPAQPAFLLCRAPLEFRHPQERQGGGSTWCLAPARLSLLGLLLALVLLVLGLVAKSLCLAQGVGLSWGLESQVWAWSVFCVSFSNLSHSRFWVCVLLNTCIASIH